MSSFWSWFIILITVITFLGCWWLIAYTKTPKKGETLGAEELGHKWDGDLVEYNNPLPKWWLNLFYLTLIFGVIYLALYPGFGNFAGFLGWSSSSAYDAQMQKAEERYGPIYAEFGSKPVEELAKTEEAVKIGRNLFANNCAACHGSNATGTTGFPDLTDDEWLWGNTAAQIEHSVVSGRNGVMPAWQASLGDDGIKQVTEYVLSLSGRSNDEGLAASGQQKYAMFCIACHGPAGKGNPMLGAPDLSNDTWLYGSSHADISESIAKGRTGAMPAHGDLLGKDKSRIVAAYVYSLSR